MNGQYTRFYIKNQDLIYNNCSKSILRSVGCVCPNKFFPTDYTNSMNYIAMNMSNLK